MAQRVTSFRSAFAACPPAPHDADVEDPCPPAGPGLEPVAQTHRFLLGRPTENAVVLAGGTLFQHYDRGFIERTPDGVVHVVTRSGLSHTYPPGEAPAAAPPAGGHFPDLFTPIAR